MRGKCLTAAAAPATPAIGSYSDTVAKWFSIQSSGHFPARRIPQLPAPSPGQIMLVTGASGSGKSTLLRRFRRQCKLQFVDIPRIPLSRKATIDHFGHTSIESALAHLSRVGLAEAHCYLLPPRGLSDGQRWRLRLALALSHESDCLRCLICDEFASLLDSVSAAVVARVLRRAVSQGVNLCAVLACCRADIVRALSPDLIVRCDFGTRQLWRKEKGESYVPAGETSQASVVHSRPTYCQARQPRRL